MRRAVLTRVRQAAGLAEEGLLLGRCSEVASCSASSSVGPGFCHQKFQAVISAPTNNSSASRAPDKQDSPCACTIDILTGCLWCPRAPCCCCQRHPAPGMVISLHHHIPRILGRAEPAPRGAMAPAGCCRCGWGKLMSFATCRARLGFCMGSDVGHQRWFGSCRRACSPAVPYSFHQRIQPCAPSVLGPGPLP